MHFGFHTSPLRIAVETTAIMYLTFGSSSPTLAALSGFAIEDMPAVIRGARASFTHEVFPFSE